jgi:hypothetical protein
MVPDDVWGTFTNYGWRPPLPESPVDDYVGLSDDARAYSLLAGDRAFTDLVHGRDAELKAPWRIDAVVSLHQEAAVYRLVR